MQLETVAIQIVLLPVELDARALELRKVHTTQETIWKVFGVVTGGAVARSLVGVLVRLLVRSV